MTLILYNTGVGLFKCVYLTVLDESVNNSHFVIALEHLLVWQDA